MQKRFGEGSQEKARGTVLLLSRAHRKKKCSKNVLQEG